MHRVRIWFESTFKTSKTISRSSVYGEWVPQGRPRCSDGEGTRVHIVIGWVFVEQAWAPTTNLLSILCFLRRWHGRLYPAIWPYNSHARCVTGLEVYGLHIPGRVSRLTPSTTAVPDCCCSNSPAPYWSKPPLLIFDIRALWRSDWTPERPNVKN